MRKLINESMQNVSLSGERGGPACGWWKVESCMLSSGKYADVFRLTCLATLNFLISLAQRMA